MPRHPDFNCLLLLGVGGTDGNLRIFQVAQHNIVPRRKGNGSQGGIQPHSRIVGKSDFCGLGREQPGSFLSGLNARFAQGPIIGWVAISAGP